MEILIWGKKIDSQHARKELALCRGLIPTSVFDDEFILNLNSSFLSHAWASCECTDVLQLSQIDEALTGNNRDQEYLLKWMNPKTCHGYAFSSYTDFAGWQPGNFKNFLKCKYGTRIPAIFLDPGVALLVKTLPLIGVLTSYSCAGHLKEPPKIVIRDKFHAQFLRCVLLSIFDATETELLEKHKIQITKELKFLATQNNEAEHFEAYWRAQSIARHLLNPVNFEHIRSIKFDLKSADELFETQAIIKRLKSGLKPITCI